jgi:hypothetical protein
MTILSSDPQTARSRVPTDGILRRDSKHNSRLVMDDDSAEIELV